MLRKMFYKKETYGSISLTPLMDEEESVDGFSINTTDSEKDVNGSKRSKDSDSKELNTISNNDERLNNNSIGVDNKALRMDDESDSVSDVYQNNNQTVTSTSGAHLLSSIPRRGSTISRTFTVSPRVTLERDAIEWSDFATKYGKQNLGRRISTSQKIAQTAGHCCDSCSLFGWFFDLFPFLVWIRNYSIRDNLLSDIISGFTIAVLHIPQGMAYGLLAGVGPINGLYVSFFPVLIYCLMGTSRHISIGTFAVVSLMLNSAANKLGAIHAGIPLVPSVANGTNVTTSFLVNNGSSPIDLNWPPTSLEALTSICLVTGIIMLVMGFLHLGSLSLILSDQLVSAFSSAAAVHVATSQLSNLFDIKLNPEITLKNAPLKLVYIWINIAQQLKNTNMATLIVSVISITVLILVKEFIEPKLKAKYGCKLPLPIDLLVIVIVTAVSYLSKLHTKYDVDIMKDIPTGLPAPKAPRVDFIKDIIPDCIALAIVTFAISLSLAKIFAKKHKYRIKPNQELIALGTANAISSFFACYPCSASLSRSSVQERTGGKTQFAGIVSCGIILVVLLFLGPLLYDLPKCILSCVILVALKSMFVQMYDLVVAWRLSRCEGIIWLVTFLAVVFLGVDIGLVVGVLFSLLIVLIRFITPHSTLLGTLPFTEMYVDIKHFAEAKEIPSIKIFQYSSALFFLNRDHFKEDILKTTINMKADDIYEGKYKGQAFVHTVIVDCSPISYIDSSGVETLCDVIETFKELSIRCYLCSCPTSVLNMFERTNFFDRIPPKFSAIFPSVHDAVIYSTHV